MLRRIDQMESELTKLEPIYNDLIGRVLKYERDNYINATNPINDPNGRDKIIIDEYITRVRSLETRLNTCFYCDETDPDNYLNESGFESMNFIARNVGKVEASLRRIKQLYLDLVVYAIRNDKPDIQTDEDHDAKASEVLERINQIRIRLDRCYDISNWNEHLFWYNNPLHRSTIEHQYMSDDYEKRYSAVMLDDNIHKHPSTVSHSVDNWWEIWKSEELSGEIMRILSKPFNEETAEEHHLPLFITTWKLFWVNHDLLSGVVDVDDHKETDKDGIETRRRSLKILITNALERSKQAGILLHGDDFMPFLGSSEE